MKMLDKALPTVETERLTLRPFSLSDSDEVQLYAGDRRIYDVTTNIPHPYEDGMAQKWIATHAAQYFEQRGITFAIALRETGQLIGAIGLIRTPIHNRAEMGYWIGVPFWNKGYCTEAAKAVIQYGFEKCGLHKIKATHLACNPASGKVMQKAGMRLEGELADEVCKDGVYHNLLTFGVVCPSA